MRNSMPIEWHKTNLENMKSYRDKIALDIERRQLDLHRAEADIAFLELQIETAIKQRKIAFDDDKYLHTRKKK